MVMSALQNGLKIKYLDYKFLNDDANIHSLLLNLIQNKIYKSMKKLLLIFAISLIHLTLLNAQTFNRINSIGNINAVTSAKKVFPFLNNETFIVSTYTVLSGPSFSNILLSTSDTSGKFSWVKLIEGNVNFVSAKMDSLGNTYIVGYTYDTYIKLDALVVPTFSGKNNFVLKLDKFKNIKWLKLLNTTNEFNISDFVISDNNALIFSGGLTSNTDFINYHIEILDSNLVSKSFKSIPFQTTVGFKFEKLCLDDDKNIYVSGFFSDSLKINDSIVLTALDSSKNNFFILKMDRGLNVINGVHIADINVVGGLIFNKSNIIISGSKSYENIFLMKLDENLTLISEYNKIGCQMYPYQIEKDDKDNYYVVIDAMCSDTINFAGQTHQFSHYKKGATFTQYSRDGFVLKFGEDLSEKNLLVIGNELGDYILNIYLKGEDEYLLCGQFSSSELTLGDTSLLNDARLTETYFHGALFSVSRNSFAFFANYSKSNTSTSLLNQKSTPITLFPNPATSNINIRWAELLKETGKLELYSVDGRLLNTQFLFPGQQQHQLNIDNLNPGVYIISLQINGNVSTAKWIKK